MSERVQILEFLAKLSELTPDVRFGQLIANLSYLAVGPTTDAIWDVEDERLLLETVSKPLQRQMDEAQVYQRDVHEGVVGPANGKTAVTMEPSIGALDQPSMTIAPEPPTVVA